MAELVRIDDEVITTENFILRLRFNNRLDGLLDQMIKERLLVRAARKNGLSASSDEVQLRADEIRRLLGLHRAAEMHAYLDGLHATVEDFENFVTDLILKNRMVEEITSDKKVEEHFKLNSPKFDTVELGHIVVAEEGVANELYATLEDDPKQFPDLAVKYSIADTGPDGGIIGTVRRGVLNPAVEGKIFNGELHKPIGPFGDEGGPYEIFMVVGRHPAKLDEFTRDEVRQALLGGWFNETVKEVAIG